MNGEEYPLAMFFASYFPHPMLEENRFAVSRINDNGSPVGQVRAVSFIDAMQGAAELHRGLLVKQLERDGFTLHPHALKGKYVDN